MRVLSIACALLSWASSILAATREIQGRIAPTDLTGLSVLPLSSDSSVVLNGGSSGSGLIARDGSFRLRNVASGEYVLSVLNRDFAFPSLLVTVPKDDEALIQVRPYTIGRIQADPAIVPTLPYPIQIKADGRIEYYDIPQAFSVTRLLKQNKMMLFMAGGLAFAVGMPKLIGMLDPEVLKEVQASQAEMHRNLNSAQNVDLAGSLSKMLSGSTDAVPGATSSSGNTARKRR